MQKIWKKKKLFIPAGAVILLFIVIFWYVNDYYPSDESVQEYLGGEDPVSVTEIGDGLFLDGLAFLAAYPTKSLKSESFSAVSIYGSEDGVLNMEKVKGGTAFMPLGYTEVCIEGGNHAQFGNYGVQKGDYDAAVSREEQQDQTITAILQMINNHKNQKQEDAEMLYEQVAPEEAKDIMDTEKDIIILDVRTQEEYASGHIKNAVCLPNEEILSEPEMLADKEQYILVYCRSGNRSKQAAQKLADMGYKKIFEFGGILDWPYPELIE